MHFVVKLFPEIIIKSAPVRKRLTRALAHNLQKLAENLDKGVEVNRDFEKIEVLFSQDFTDKAAAVALLASTPGIAKFSESQVFDFHSIDQAAEVCLPLVAERIAGKTFVVRVKRSGSHKFNSTDVERKVGGHLLHNSEASGVNLKSPEEKVELEIRKDTLFVLGQSWEGLGGFPLGTQENVLSLISGGFDSSVASYLATKRGLLTHYLFFNLGGRAHEIGVKEVASFLWGKYSSSHRVNFITVPFEEVVAEILVNIPKSYMGVALKRMMYRAANTIADKYGFRSIVTGESVAQVSSQTLSNLAAIDSVSETLVLRPLITMDKGEIIDIARKIGTEDFAANMPEYCGVISRKPTTAAKKSIIEDAETSFDFSKLERAVASHKCENIENVLHSIDEIPVDIYETPVPKSIIVDVRHPDETHQNPFQKDELGIDTVIEIPYFKLQKDFAKLDAKTRYLLYCDRGVMSRLHAELLIDSGMRNVGVYRP